jgi:hypothetical protein
VRVPVFLRRVSHGLAFHVRASLRQVSVLGRPRAFGPAREPGPVRASLTRPSSGDLGRFLDINAPGGGRPGTLPATRPGGLPSGVAGGIAGGVAGAAAADFLRDSGARPGTLPAERPGIGDRPGIGERPGAGERPGIGDRPGLADRPLVSNRPDRIENRQEYRQNRTERRDQIRDQINDQPIRDFWSDHPLWGAWAITRPFRWATWGGVAGWVDYGWSEPAEYYYGENVYYEDGSVYYGDSVVASAEEYADQAEAIAASAPEAAPDKSEWMPLGVFALTPDGQSAGPTPNLFLQLAVSKEGVISGILNDSTTNTSQTIEGMVDKATQRSAWNVVGKTRPIMETGLFNLTQDTAPALVHFADGTTQQWLMVRLPDPEGEQP